MITRLILTTEPWKLNCNELLAWANDVPVKCPCDGSLGQPGFRSRIVGISSCFCSSYELSSSDIYIYIDVSASCFCNLSSWIKGNTIILCFSSTKTGKCHVWSGSSNVAGCVQFHFIVLNLLIWCTCRLVSQWQCFPLIHLDNMGRLETRTWGALRILVSSSSIEFTHLWWHLYLWHVIGSSLCRAKHGRGPDLTCLTTWICCHQ